MERKKKINNIYTILLILFLLEVLLFPIVVWHISLKEADPNVHIVTYEDNKLECDKNTDVDDSGTISIPLFEERYEKKTVYKLEPDNENPDIYMNLDEMDSFDSEYGNIVSSDGTRIIAPGASKTSVIRIKNKENMSLKYNAVLFKNATTSNLPVDVRLKGEGKKADAKYPDGVYTKDDIIHSVEGEIKPGESEEFEISWDWDYSSSELQDMIDTELGDKAAFENPDEIVVGFRIVAEEELDSYIVPTGPKTGDTTEMGGYIVLMAISLFVLILILIEKDKENEKGSKYNF